jgi:hypothetical protein
MTSEQPPKVSMTPEENTISRFNFLIENRSNFSGKTLKMWNDNSKQDFTPEVIQGLRVDHDNNLVITTTGGNEHSLKPHGGINAAIDFFNYKDNETGMVYVVSQNEKAV